MKYFYLIFILFITLFINYNDAASKFQVPSKRVYMNTQNNWFNNILLNGKIEVPKESDDITLMEYYRMLSVSLYSRNENVLSVILDEIWHSVFINETAPYGNGVSLPFLSMMRDLIDETTTLYDTTNTRAKFDLIYQYTTEFRTAIDNFKLNPRALGAVRESFEQLEELFTTQLTDGVGFRKPAKQLQQIPIFTLTATSHLFMLSEVIRYGQSWGYTDTELLAYQSKLDLKLREYLEYVSDTYDVGASALFEGVDPEDMNADDYEVFIQFKNVYIQTVSDFAMNWWMMDSKLKSGTYAERVRYLFSDIVGFNVDPDVSDFNGYYNPTFDRVLEMAESADINRFRGILNSAVFEYQDQQFILSVKSLFTDPADYTSQCNSTSAKVCTNYYISNRGSLFNATEQFGNHKIGNIFGWNLNTRALSYPVPDALTVAFLPSEVFANNLIVKSIATVVNAQKYLSQDGTAFLSADYNNLPGSHVMMLDNQTSITYRLDSAYSTPTTFSLSLHCILADKRPASITMLDHTQTPVATYALSYTPFPQILSANPSYNITLHPGELNNDFTFIVNGGQVALQSLVLTPL
ncbi:hypothetical protein PPL_04716 [Heterostelium album PN500]|uniref:Pesticidal crystal protein domain-containing protein n=1 Tax=Heterostelium pallidum (strain ATCC 26659 / Pp 5 / PN500) TaxID=670386 RepID=D3B8C4_HETP5|nr:hypothetical protein PPL_04716 [Heterostelium album PN500]EFA82292.1 hypothetical protein PPL_04716 [Heterostelium album PN500]|eukprot:XP_020434409.1 hypothetical protein PPL_04716 [Heterostelium album PN500]